MRLAALCVPFFLCPKLFAQPTVKATIYTTANTTINAAVKKTAYEGTPQAFSYTEISQTDSKQIAAAEIKSIVFEDGQRLENHFIKINVLIRDYLYRTAEDYNFQSSVLAQNVLLERLVDGPIALYLFIDKYQFPHFFIKQSADTVLQHLRYKSYAIGSKKLHQDQLYKNTINDLLEKDKCPTVTETDLERLTYEAKPMTQLFKRINACLGTVTNDSSKKRKKDRIHFGILGGVASTYLHIQNTPTDRYFSALAGVYIDIVPAKSLQDYTFSVELSAKPYYMKRYSAEAEVAGMRELDYTIVNVTPIIRKFFLMEGSGAFYEGGMSFGGTTKGKETYIYKDIVGNETTKVYDDKKGLWGLVAGGGIDLKRVVFRLRYTGFPIVNKSNYFSGQVNVRLF